MSTVIVGVDDSPRANDAIALAGDLAGGAGARIVLAGCVPAPTIPLVGAAAIEVAGVPAEAERAVELMLQRKRGLLGGLDAEVETVTRLHVSPPQMLQSLAEERHADLLVVGSTHVGRAGRVLPGSTGERLLHGAPCPVAIAPADHADRRGEPLRRIGVAYDGSAESRAALAGAVALASRAGAEVELIAVLDVIAFSAPALMSEPGYDRTRADLEADARERLDAALAELPPTVHATGVLLAGDPVDQLAERSTALDLICAGSRRYGPLRAVLLGGVTGRLLRLASCPVIVTPRGVKRPLAALVPSRSADPSPR